MGDLGRALLGGLIVAVLAVAPSAAIEPAPPLLTADEYLALFDDATLRGVERPADEVYDLFIDITGDEALDARIRDAAEARGYRRQPVASIDLVRVDGRELQAPAAEAWERLQARARASGLSIVLTSAHRDLRDQRSLFRERLGSRSSDAAIEAVLRIAAPPGYSKHHSGYAIDVGQVGTDRAGFGNTAAYAWLSADDFAQARAHGFVPSYPEGGADMGPDPEPWEFVWVGTGRIACGLDAVFPSGFCDVGPGPRADDIAWLVERGITVGCAPGRFCPDDPITRGEAASMIWRLYGAPDPLESAPFSDVFADDHYATAVDWLWRAGVTEGTSASTFSPNAVLTPDQSFAMVVRLAGVDGPAPIGLLGPVPEFATDVVEVGEVGLQLSRAEFASILRASTVR
ncbi:MAG: D-alanyl-D-alanine carboxypeptidase family protein [Actinomycetota bacterium]